MKVFVGAWVPPKKAKAKALRWLLVAVMITATGASLLTASLVLLPPKGSFVVNGNSLVVQIREGVWRETKKFSLESLEESKRLSLSRGRKISGMRFPGYCHGWFSYPELGRVWQVTDCGHEVVFLRFASGNRVLLAPHDPEGFLAAATQRQPASFVLRGHAGMQPALGWWAVLFLLPALVCIPVTAMVLLAPARLAYALEPGTLVIRTLARLKRFDLQGATAHILEPQRLARLAGSSMPGYYVGLFWYQGKPLWVYGSNISRGLLIEGEKRVFITPEDEEAFLVMLREVGVATP